MCCSLCLGGTGGAWAETNDLGLPALQGWDALNRNLSLHVSSTQQRYTELDTQALTTSGVLDRETGQSSGWGVQLRWQGQAGAVPLWLQADTGYSTGQTDYNGHLQRGNALTPYQAKTGNVWQSTSLRVGLPLTTDKLNSWQFIPYLDWTQQHWQRNLVQYGESYKQSKESLGLLVQWQPAWPALLGHVDQAHKPWLLELGHQRSTSQRSHAAVPNLDFAASQETGPVHQTEVGLRYAITPRWQLQLRAQHTQSSTLASAVVNGLQSPPSQTQQTLLAIGLGWTY